MRKANVIKFTIYFLLFAVILYFEYYAIEMQGGEWIAHDDRRPLVSMMALIGICPISSYSTGTNFGWKTRMKEL